MNISPKTLILLMATIWLSACSDFLDVKPSRSLVIPQSFEELEGLLNDNSLGLNSDPGLGNISVDDIELTQGAFLTLTQLERNAYLWEADPNLEEVSYEWANLYKRIYNANMVLESIDDLEEHPEVNNLKGKALFIKGLAYFTLLQHYSLPYDPATANEILGIPLRNTADINQLTKRASLQESYEEVERLLIESASLMHLKDESRKTPSQWAAFALLSRFYLVKGEYDKSLEAAEKSLAIGGELIDYNTLDPQAPYPFPEFGEENIYNVTLAVRGVWFSSGTAVSGELYDRYHSTDLRKVLFFRESPEGVMIFKGTYSGNYQLFSGIATDELYLTKAECLARLDRGEEAIDVLNQLLEKRYVTGTYQNISGLFGKDILSKILDERRKQLVFRNSRWIDLRRLSLDSDLAILMSRTVDGKEYRLDPGDSRFAFPIPLDEIRLNNLIQNHGYE